MASMTVDAGASAYEQADLHDAIADSIELQLRTLTEILSAQRQRAGRFRVGAAGEQAVAREVERVLIDIGSPDWHALADRRWPGSRHANLDLVLVGPPGVLILDSKKWADPRIEGDVLWNGDACEDDSLDSLRDQADAVARALAHCGLAPTAVEPFLVLVGRTLAPVSLRGVTVVGERSIHRSLIRMSPRLDSTGVHTVLAGLDDACPPARRAATATTRQLNRPRSADVARTSPPPPEEPALALFDEAQLWADLVACAEREPIESWMTWLHPAQAQLASRTYNGPARIRGAAGTGKTVVALHRARLLARQPGARVLMTSYVRTLPDVHRGLFTRLAPAEAGKVEFVGIHAWASRHLRARDLLTGTLDGRDGGRRVFRHVWTRFDERDKLLSQVDSEDYWWDEIQSVIKGRGLRVESAYLSLTRIGRRTPLQESFRRLVWQLFTAYQDEMGRRGLLDYADLLDLALASVTTAPLDEPYTAVIVDEVQDLTCQGLRLLHALAGDAEDALLLVGDGQQAVYPGGFTLAEAGVYVPGGRAAVLGVNYRNGEEILRRSMQVVGGDTFDDLDAISEQGGREVHVARPGGQVLEVRTDDEPSLGAALHSALTWAARQHRYGDMAILVRTNHEAQRHAEALATAGIPVQQLRSYDGTTVDAVKVGTYQRAKGLEFAVVFLPHHDRAVPPQTESESDSAYAERAELQHRQLFVAMTRARDRLWLGAVAPRCEDAAAV